MPPEVVETVRSSLQFFDSPRPTRPLCAPKKAPSQMQLHQDGNFVLMDLPALERNVSLASKVNEMKSVGRPDARSNKQVQTRDCVPLRV